MKKGQAAIEFLTTYGWAFLMMVITLGALIYFGVFNPEGALPERCTFPSSFYCQDYIVIGGADQNASLVLLNTFGKTIVIQNVSCEFDDGQVFIDNANQNTDWNPKAALNVNCPVPFGQILVSGSKAKILVTILYTLETGGYNHFGQGEIYANVQ